MDVHIPNQLLEVVENRECILYAGEEFSLKANLPNGSRLPKEVTLAYRLSRELFENECPAQSPDSVGDGFLDLARLADDYESVFGRDCLIRAVADVFAPSKARPGTVHDMAVRLFSHIITTSYDRFFETAAALRGIPWQTFHRDAQFSCLRTNEGITLYKLRGGLDDLNHIVITSVDYTRNPIHKHMRLKLESLLASKTAVILGCGRAGGEYNEMYFELMKRLGVHKPLTFAVTPFPVKRSAAYDQWKEFRKVWEGRGVYFLDGAPETFLHSLNECASVAMTGANGLSKSVATASDLDISSANVDHRLIEIL